MGRIIKTNTTFNALLTSEFDESPNDDCRIICLTSRDITVIRKALVPMYWITRFGEYVNPGLFEIHDNSNLVELLEELEVKLMANCYDGLQAIANSIALLAKPQCCDFVNNITINNGGVNGNLGDGTVTYGTEPYGTEPVALPEGYETEEEYLVEKCAIASALTDALIGVVRSLETIGAFEAIATTIVLIIGVFGIIVLPEVVIPALVVAIAACWGLTGVFLAVANEMEERKQDIICAMYTGESASEVLQLLADIFDEIIALISVSTPVGVAIKTILMILVNEDTLKKLFASYAGFHYPDVGALCENCGADVMRIPIYCEGSQYEQVEGEIVSGDLVDGPITLSSVLVNYRCGSGNLDYDTAIAVAAPETAYYFSWDYTDNVDWKVCCEWMDENGQNHLVANAENVQQPLLARLVRIRDNNPAFPAFECTFSWSETA